MRQHPDNFFLQVFAQFLSQRVGHDVDLTYVEREFFELVDGAELVFSQVQVLEGGQMGKGGHEGLDLVVSEGKSPQDW